MVNLDNDKREDGILVILKDCLKDEKSNVTSLPSTFTICKLITLRGSPHSYKKSQTEDSSIVNFKDYLLDKSLLSGKLLSLANSTSTIMIITPTSQEEIFFQLLQTINFHSNGEKQNSA